MSFGQQIKTTKIEAKKEVPSWMSIEPVVQDKPKEPVQYVDLQEDFFWKYPELKVDQSVIHKIPKSLENAILRNKDFANWFETVWMLLNLNARWNLNEAIIPEHLRHYVGARSIGSEGNWKSNKNEVIWYLYK
jgi:hypothetical protein